MKNTYKSAGDLRPGDLWMDLKNTSHRVVEVTAHPLPRIVMVTSEELVSGERSTVHLYRSNRVRMVVYGEDA